MTSVSGVVLAAGRGTRMGVTKQLLPLGGRPLLSHVLDTALASTLDDVVVVLGYEAAVVRSKLSSYENRVRFVVNQNHGEGQSRSLAAGLDALHKDTGAAVVLLGDQPTIACEAINALVTAYRRRPGLAARAEYDAGVLAHPTLIARVLWDEVRAVQGDVGAREVLRLHDSAVVRVRVGGAAPRDVDTDADYQNLIANADG